MRSCKPNGKTKQKSLFLNLCFWVYPDNFDNVSDLISAHFIFQSSNKISWTGLMKTNSHWQFTHLALLHVISTMTRNNSHLDNTKEAFIKFIYSEKAIKFTYTFDWHYIHRTKVRWRFRKILWPSQNIWTLQASKAKMGH